MNCGWPAHQNHPYRRFNPHSPLLANELAACGWWWRTWGVSIHIRHCWRMNCSCGLHVLCHAFCFNPHSPLLANEFQEAIGSCPCGQCFNPHSPLLANEFWAGCQCARRVKPVSIHIRHCWRMNFHGPVQLRHATMGFNPHSPLLANEFHPPTAQRVWHPVSIHIRHCWRMNFFTGGDAGAELAVSIHIRHCWRMNLRAAGVGMAIDAFQSTFAIAGE